MVSEDLKKPIVLSQRDPYYKQEFLCASMSYKREEKRKPLKPLAFLQGRASCTLTSEHN